MLDDYIDLVQEALASCTAHQERVYRATTGIQPDGCTTEPMSITQAAHHLGMTRGTVTSHLGIAERKVYKHIALTLIRQDQSRKRAERLFPGLIVNDEGRRYSLPSEDAVHLGAASHTYTSAAKNGTGHRTTTIDVQQRYCTPHTPHTGRQLLHRIWGDTTRAH